MKCFNRIIAAVVLILSFGLGQEAYSQARITQATGGGYIPTGSFKEVGPITITETELNDFTDLGSTLEMQIDAPSGFDFKTSGSVSATNNPTFGSGDLSLGSITVTSSSIFIDITVTSSLSNDKVVISGIEVQANSQDTKGKLVYSSGSTQPINGVSAGTNLGNLSAESCCNIFGLTGLFNVPEVTKAAADWGDYDNDGKLDLLLNGVDDTPDERTAVYHNDGAGNFSQVFAAPPAVKNGDVEWADFNNDGLLDFIYCGSFGFSNDPATVLYENTGASFSQVTAGIINLKRSAIAVGDINNDGLPDIFVTGQDGSLANDWGLYLNDGGFSFTDISGNLPGSISPLRQGNAAFADFDRDGDLDLALNGLGGGTKQTQLFENDGSGGFTNTSLSSDLDGVNNGDLTWVDYNNDGYPDLHIVGMDNSSDRRAPLYENQGASSFSDISAGFNEVNLGTIAWGDINNDGLQDVVIQGDDGGGESTTVYIQENSDFRQLSGAGATDMRDGALSLVDYNDDGRLDIFQSGEGFSGNTNGLYNNQQTMRPNTRPEKVTGLTANTVGSDTLQFAWNPSNDSATPAKNLTYQLMVGTSSGNYDIIGRKALNSPDGERIVNGRGNQGHTAQGKLNVAPGQEYFYRVQAIDGGKVGSPLGSEQSIILSLPAPEAPGAGYALKMDGNDDHVGLGSVANDSLAHINNFTIEWWEKNESPFSDEVVYRSSDATNSLGYEILSRGDELVFFNLGSDNSYTFTAPPHVQAGRWNHWALSVNSSNQVTAYVNGQALSTQSLSTNLNVSLAGTPEPVIGGNANSFGSFFSGQIDEVRYWRTTLTQAQVQGFMCQKSLASHPQKNTLKFYYRFDNQSDTTQVSDYSGNLVNGNLLNFDAQPKRISGAAIGDTSIQAYGSFSELKMELPADTFRAFDPQGFSSTQGVHLYHVRNTSILDSVPAQMSGFQNDSGYFGLYKHGNAANNYKAEWFYGGHPALANAANEAQIRVAERHNAADSTWRLGSGGLAVDTARNRILLTSNFGTEFVTGFAQSNYPDRPGAGRTLVFSGDIGVDSASLFSDKTTDLTISAWVKWEDPGGAPADRLLLYNGDPVSGVGYGVYLNNGNQLVFDIDGNVQTTGISLVNGRWTHIALVNDGSQWLLFRNGQQIGTFASPASNPSTGLTPAFYLAHEPGAANRFHGRIDEVRFWNTGFSPTQIRERLAEKTDTNDPQKSNLAAYYRMDEGSGNDTAKDLMGGNPMILSFNGTAWDTSGAALGDTSAYVQNGSFVELRDGDTISVDNGGNNITALHLYKVKDKPNQTTVNTNFNPVDTMRYFGSFAFDDGATTINLTTTYEYQTNTNINVCTPEMAVRPTNASGSWVDTNATDNPGPEELVKGPTFGARAEYLLGNEVSTPTGYDVAWTGCVNQNWFEPGNWSTGSVPTSTDDVWIPNRPNNPTIFNSEVGQCRTIDINVSGGAEVTIQESLGAELIVNTP